MFDDRHCIRFGYTHFPKEKSWKLSLKDGWAFQSSANIGTVRISRSDRVHPHTNLSFSLSPRNLDPISSKQVISLTILTCPFIDNRAMSRLVKVWGGSFTNSKKTLKFSEKKRKLAKYLEEKRNRKKIKNQVSWKISFIEKKVSRKFVVFIFSLLLQEKKTYRTNSLALRSITRAPHNCQTQAHAVVIIA